MNSKLEFVKATEVPTRPNLFRAWDIRKERMIHDALQLTEIKQLIKADEAFNDPFSFFDGCKWMYFTGLYDKNKKPIYENDVLKETLDLSNSAVPDEEVRFIHIIWDDGAFKYLNCYGSKFNFFQAMADRCEVVGNIYENPEY